MIDFSKKLRRIVCILARWDVRLRFTIPSPDTSERVLEIIDNVDTRLEQGVEYSARLEYLEQSQARPYQECQEGWLPGSFGLPDLTDVDLSVQRIGKLILIKSDFDKILSFMNGFIHI